MSASDVLILSSVESPVGALAFACDAEGVVRGCSFAGGNAAGSGGGLGRAIAREYPGARIETGEAQAALVGALADYFGGDRRALERIAWSLDGSASEAGFQARVWRALADVPAGVTISYGEMAKRAGEPGAAQATGVALNRNPIALVLACHRVVGADGAMVGFGGGLERKTWLLRHEGALLI
ncbi:methylated-DNA--[protein]-cysteine S-methyltransferase [soil metagenome]